MTSAEIKRRVNEIRIIGVAHVDDESAHIHEDALMRDFIKEVSKTGDRRLKMMAREVLKTGEINFARWCA